MTNLPNLRCKVESMVQAILNDANERHPNSMDELLQKNEFRNKKPIAFTGDVSEPKAFESLRASLGLIFSERYGWAEETIDKLTLPEVFIALEHAMEYDAPSKKSVWKL